MTNFQTKIVLYDIPSLLPGGRAVSPFTNVVRYALEYKRLSFSTTYIPLHLIASECQRLGIPPTGTKFDSNHNRIPSYTLPGIVDDTHGDSLLIVDSVKTLQYLEATYPTPDRALFPGTELGTSAPALYILAEQFIMGNIMMNALPLVAEGLYSVMEDESKPYWLSNFLANHGHGASTLKDALPQKGTQAYDAQVQKLVCGLESVASALEKNSSRTAGAQGEVGWLMGDRPVYTDLKLRAFLNVIRSSSPEAWQVVRSVGGGVFERYFCLWDTTV